MRRQEDVLRKRTEEEDSGRIRQKTNIEKEGCDLCVFFLLLPHGGL